MENPERFFVYETYCRYPEGCGGPLKLTALHPMKAKRIMWLTTAHRLRRYLGENVNAQADKFLLKCCGLRKKNVPLRLQTGNACARARRKAAAAARQSWFACD